jgi:hypothetical protein
VEDRASRAQFESTVANVGTAKAVFEERDIGEGGRVLAIVAIVGVVGTEAVRLLMRGRCSASRS